MVLAVDYGPSDYFSVVIGEVKRNTKEELNGKVSKRSVASLMEELILGAT